MRLILIILLLHIFINHSFSQASINLSSKNILSLDAGLSLLFDLEKPFFEIYKDSSTQITKNIALFNSLGITSNNLAISYVWGNDFGHGGFDYNWVYLLYGYNWWEKYFTKKGYYWGAGIKKSAYILIFKLEYQRIYKRKSNLFLIEIGVGV